MDVGWNITINQRCSANHLVPAVEYVLTVQAEDTVGNVTDDGPMVTVIPTTKHRLFSRGERLNIVQTGVDSVSLTWSKATTMSA